MRRVHRNHTSGIAVGLVAGAAVGAGLALAFAPLRGSDTRQRIRQYGRHTIDVVNGAGEKLRAKGQHLAERGRGVVAHAVDRGSQVAAAARAVGRR